MNRLKVGVYAAFAVAVALAPAVLVTTSWTPHAIARADATLRATEALVQLQARELTHRALATAREAATVPAVQEVVVARGDLQAAAVAAATGILPPAGGRALLVATSAGGILEQHLAGSDAPFGGDPRVAEVVAGVAKDGRAREALVKAGDQLFAVGAVPAGPGNAIAVGLPVNLAALAPPREAGPVELLAHGWRSWSAAGPAAQPVVTAALASPGRPVSAGALRPIAVLPAPWPALPVSFLRAPGHRALALPVPGVPDASVIADLELRPLLAPAAAVAWASLAGATLALLFGLLALWGVTEEQRTVIPRALVNVADRVARGDFAARAPALAGSLGTLSSALNRAATAAQEAQRQAARAGPVAPTGAAPLPDLGAGPVERVRPAPEEAPPPAPPAPPAAAPDFFAPPEGHALAEAAPPAPAAAAPAPPPAPPEPPPAPPAPRTEEVTAVTSAAPLPRREITGEVEEHGGNGPDEDEAHWQAVFQDFLRVRGECGEAQAGVTYPRFREKLQANRAQLMAKYACRTVRFQVYVKDGKAALKASPVR